MSGEYNKIGAWEYKIVTSSNNASEIETIMNQLGSDRWECFSVQSTDAGKEFYLKRPSRSVLQKIPMSDLIKVIGILNSGGGNDGGE